MTATTLNTIMTKRRKRKSLEMYIREQEDRDVQKGMILAVILCIILFIAVFFSLKDFENPIHTAINSTVSTCTNVTGGDVCTHSVRK